MSAVLTFFTSVWNWITTNHELLKNLLWIAFTFVATLIAWLTYRRARHTLLQPLRSEVVKRQTDLLVGLLDFLYDDGVDFSSKADYAGIIACNAYCLMRDYGFVLADNGMLNAVNANCGGMLVLKEKGSLSFVELPNLFEEKVSEEEYKRRRIELSKGRYELGKQGIVDLEYLYTTKQFLAFEQQLLHFIENPFMPGDIQCLLRQLSDDIQYNVSVATKAVLEDFLIQLCTKQEKASKEKPLSIQHQAIYNDYIRKSKQHSDQINKIKRKTREYLMVDQKWG